MPLKNPRKFNFKIVGIEMEKRCDRGCVVVKDADGNSLWEHENLGLKVKMTKIISRNYFVQNLKFSKNLKF